MLKKYSKSTGKPIITAVADLNNRMIRENGLFVIGGSAITDADMKVPDPSLTFRHYFATKQQANFVPNGDPHPMAIGIIKSEIIPDFLISDKKRQIEITENWVQILKERIIDLVVYARRAPAESCLIFEQLYPIFATKNGYLLRDFDKQWGRDFSLSRCTDYTEPFYPECFRLSTPTPGAENMCDLTQYTFKGRIYEITPQLIRIIPNQPEQTVECDAPEPPEAYQSIISDKVKKKVDQIEKIYSNETCSRSLDDINVNRNKDTLTTTLTRIRSEGGDADAFEEWESPKNFKPIWIEYIKKDYPGLMPIELISNSQEVKSWFIYDTNTKSYNCRLCVSHFNKFGINKRLFNRVADPLGIRPANDNRYNYDAIKDHYNSRLHRAVVNKLQIYGIEKSSKYFIDKQIEKEIKTKELAATMRMMRTIYAEIIANVA